MVVLVQQLKATALPLKEKQMQIKYLTADNNWQNRLEENGFGFHTDENNLPYWIEHYYYSIDEKFANTLYEATN